MGITTHQYNPRNSLPSAKDEIAEILVFGEKNPLLVLRKLDHIGIIQASRSFGNIKHIVAVSSKEFDQRRRNTLVSQPAHVQR